MSGKLKIALPVIVEGKYDKIKLDSLLDANIITTGGFGIFNSREKKALIRRLCAGGVILLCDSDGAGKVIRGYLKSFLPPERVYDLYIPKIAGKERRKRIGSKEGTLGVEGMDAELLRALFAPYATDSLPARTPITKADFYAYGLSGGANAAALRDALAAQFDAAPDYRGDALRFVSGGEPAGIYDDLGATAMDGVRKVVRDLDDAELLTWWKELDPDEA